MRHRWLALTAAVLLVLVGLVGNVVANTIELPSGQWRLVAWVALGVLLLLVAVLEWRRSAAPKPSGEPSPPRPPGHAGTRWRAAIAGAVAATLAAIAVAAFWPQVHLGLPTRKLTVSDPPFDVAKVMLVRSTEVSELVQPVTKLVFSPDSKLVAIGGRDGVIVLDAAGGEEVFRLGRSAKACMAFSPDGKRLAVSRGDQMVAIVDVASRELVSEFAVGAAVTDCAYRPAGGPQLVAGCNDGTLRWFGTDNYSQLGPPADAYFFTTNSLAFSDDGHRLITTGRNLGNQNAVRVWNPDSHEPQDQGHRWTTGTAVAGPGKDQVISGGPDERLVIGSGDGTVVPVTANVNQLALSPDKRTVGVAIGRDAGSLMLLDAGDGRLLGGNALTSTTHPMTAVAFSKDGAYLAAASWDKLWIWKLS